MDQYLVAPDEVREPKVEPAAFVRDELHAARDVALDEGEHLTALIVETERTRRAVESLVLDVLQEIDNGRRPRVASAPNRVTSANPDSRRFAVGHVPRWHEVGELPLGHCLVIDEARRPRQRIWRQTIAWLADGLRHSTTIQRAVDPAFGDTGAVVLGDARSEAGRRSLRGDLCASAARWFRDRERERQLAKRVQLVEGAIAALDHAWNDIVAPVTDGDLEHVEDLCRCEHRRPLPAD
jgi:hypothetical protein